MKATTLVKIVSDDSNMDNWRLELQPDLTYSTGEYSLYIYAKLENYPVWKRELFKVSVLDCVATIDITSVELSTLTNAWYSAPVNYDLSTTGA